MEGRGLSLNKSMNVTVRLDEIADIRLGMPFKTAINDLGDEGKCYLIQTKDIDTEGLLRMGDLARVSPPVDPEKHYLQDGDILLRLRGPIFAAGAFTGSSALPSITSNQNAIIKCKEDKAIPGYLQWYINSPFGQQYFHSMSEGTSITKIGLKTLAEMEIKLPSLDVQTKISRIKDNWEKQRDIHRKIVNNGNLLYLSVCLNLLGEGE